MTRNKDKRKKKTTTKMMMITLHCMHTYREKSIYYLLVIHMQIHKYMHKSFTLQLVQ